MDKADSYLADWKRLLEQFHTPAFDAISDLVEQVEAFAAITHDQDAFKEHDLLSGKSFKSRVHGRWINNGLAYLIDIHAANNQERVMASVMLAPSDGNKFHIFASRSYEGDECDMHNNQDFDFTGLSQADEEHKLLDVYREFHKTLVWALPPVDRPLFVHTLHSSGRYDLTTEIIYDKFSAGKPEDSIRAYFHSMTSARDKNEKSPSALGEMRERWNDHMIACGIRMAAI